ncbi:MAG: PLP-dependent aminotransferase family protein [Chloroflexota bacterium]
MKTADWIAQFRPSQLANMNRHFQGIENFISLAGGLPDPDLMPKEALANAAHEVITTKPSALQYGGDLGELKDHLIELMGRRGIKTTHKGITITAGGQHGMDMFTRLFLNPGGRVMLAQLSYTGIQQAIMPYCPEILTVPISPTTGLDLDALEAQLEAGAKPAFLYTVAAAHNPMGVTMQLARRERLMEIARRYQMPVVEDDAYGFLEYDGESVPALTAIDPEWAVYIGSFAKILAPGFRMGWIVAPEEHFDTLLTIRRLSVLSASPLHQNIIATYFTQNNFSEQLDTIQAAYKRRRDVMLDAMAEHFPEEVTYYKPSGGMFIWVELPKDLDAYEVVQRSAKEAAVGFVPAMAFVSHPDDMEAFKPYMRLTFVRYGEEVLVEGVARLGRVLKEIVNEK